jgi:V/A-type H+/Na+-transporting ATPase subunit E
MADNAHPNSSGIESLISRLRQEGVDEGRSEAERIVVEAERRARRILDEAEAEAAHTRNSAEDDANRFRRGGEEALRTAMRDAVLDMKETLTRRFAEQVRGTVSELTRDDEMLKRMIIAVVGRARDEAGVAGKADLEFILPRSVIELDQLRRNPEELREGSLAHFAASAAAEMLREGVSFSRAEDEADGIRVALKEEGLIIDLTDRAVADVILRHLQPRFRALLEGVVN